MRKIIKPFSVLLTTLFVSFNINTSALSKAIVLTNKKDDLRILQNANEAANKKDYKKAIELFSKIVNRNPSDEESKVKLAYLLYSNKQYNEAIEIFSQVEEESKNKEYVKYAKEMLKLLGVTKKSGFNKRAKLEKKSEDKKDKREYVELGYNDQVSYICNPSDPTIFKDPFKHYFRRWEKEEMPIKVFIPDVPYNLSNDSTKYRNLVKKSINRWTDKAPDIIKIYYTDNKDNANVFIDWIEFFEDRSSWGQALLPIYDKQSQKRISIIRLALKTQPGTATFTKKSVYFSDDEFINVVTHEFGHSLGLAHSFQEDNNNDIMAPSYQSLMPEELVEITERDINTLKKLYSLPKNAVCECK